MKNVFWGLLLAAPLIMLSSGCKKFLDRKPLTATLDDLNQGGVEGQIYGLYGAIRNGDVAGQGFGGIPWQGMQNFRSDDSEKGSDPGDGADWGVIYDQFQYVKDHWSTNTYWDQHYVLIGQANTAIQTADSLGLNDVPASKINIAEAKFFRAFAYFDLVRAYGEVPLINFRVYNPADSRKPKATVAQIYAQIDADLQYAITNLPVNWNNASGISKFPGRLTLNAAKALQAKAMLYRQNWSGALGLCQQIISSGQYSLLSDFNKVFTDAGENSSESIWEIQADIGANGADNYYSWYAICQGVRGAGDWDLGWGWNAPTQELVDAYQPGDVRKGATILFSGQSDGIYGKVLPAFPSIARKYWNKKVYPSPTQQVFTGSRQGGWINQRVIRYSDVLLMAAEAANELGGAANVTLAEGYLNQVRNRATLGNVSFVSQAQMRTAIQNERRYELALEGERFYDLVRWGLASSVLGPSGYLTKHKWYPIPQPAIDFAGGILVQNPDYP
ncbi:MAG: RagB/SusD family nutrient uptake outer membrane protein [Ferruginibacter sp.]